jgi:hypothetical protein
LIPHPLTLLFCWLLGAGLSNALGYVLEFAGELFADGARYGWIGSGSFAAALAGLGIIAAFAGSFFTGAAMRLLAEKSWPKAAGWALLAAFIVHFRTPLSLLWAAPACCLGAFVCDRFRDDRRLEAAEGLMRSWMFWER